MTPGTPGETARSMRSTPGGTGNPASATTSMSPCPMSAIASAIRWLSTPDFFKRAPPASLFVPKRLRRRESRRLPRGDQRHQQSGNQRDDQDQGDDRPRHRKLDVLGACEVFTRKEIASEEETEDGPTDDSKPDDKGGFDQERQRDQRLLVPDRPQDADLLAAFDDRSERDHANRRDPDNQTESHETLEDQQESVRLCLRVLELLANRLALHAVLDQFGLDLLRHFVGLIGIAQTEEIGDHGWIRVDRQRQRLCTEQAVQRGYLAIDHADHANRPLRTVRGLNLNGDRI